IPSPSSQNLRSAPQKHPKPKIAVSEPSGYGPLSGRPLTKWREAVAIGSLRPGSAVAALGISSFFLNMNILISSSRADLCLTYKLWRTASYAFRDHEQGSQCAGAPSARVSLSESGNRRFSDHSRLAAFFGGPAVSKLPQLYQKPRRRAHR